MRLGGASLKEKSRRLELAIAERLGLSKSTVMVHMMRALSHCRDRLSED